MKEIGKLIELLNEYSKKKHNLAMRELNGELGLGFHYLNYGSSYSELLMISKKYEFIKWLVDNDKINIEKLLNDQKEYFILQVGNDNYNSENYFVDGLLMLLSIQDEPIRFLCDMLK